VEELTSWTLILSYHLLMQTRSFEDRALPIAWCKGARLRAGVYTALGHEPVERADGGPFLRQYSTPC
jgi:hypothetical protein